MRSRQQPADLPSLDVLVVDDEPGIRRTMTLHLEGRGHRVASAATPAEALGRLAAGRFDVVFLDLRLGTESGLDLLPRLAERGNTSNAMLRRGNAAVGRRTS